MTDDPRFHARLRDALIKDFELEPDAADEAAFHLTDWLNDYARFEAVRRDPESSDADLVSAALGLTTHAAWHLAAAHKILYFEPVEDIFKLGAVKGDGIAKREPGKPYQR